MTHPHQAGASAEALAAENACLARAVTRLVETLRRVAREDTQHGNWINFVLAKEREAIEAAARVWPPVAE